MPLQKIGTPGSFRFATVMADTLRDQWTRQHVLGASPGGILSRAARFGKSLLGSRA